MDKTISFHMRDHSLFLVYKGQKTNQSSKNVHCYLSGTPIMVEELYRALRSFAKDKKYVIE